MRLTVFSRFRGNLVSVSLGACRPIAPAGAPFVKPAGCARIDRPGRPGNVRQEWPDRLGAGWVLAPLRISEAVGGASLCPRPTSSL